MKKCRYLSFLFSLGVCATMLIALPAAGANTTNYFGTTDYTNDFEQYNLGDQLADGAQFAPNGTDGWYALDADAVVVTTNELIAGEHPYLKAEGVPPLTNAHLQILQLNYDATNLVTPENGVAVTTPFYVDMLVMPKRWDEDKHPAIPADNRTAVYFNSNGYLRAYARYTTNAAASFETNWVTFTDFKLETNRWVRLTISMEMEKIFGEDFFQVKLDGQSLNHAYGAPQPSDRTLNPGTWFQCAEYLTAANIKSIVCKGTGKLDDMVVTTNNPLPANKVSVLVTVDPAGSAPSAPGGIVDQGSVTFTEGPGTASLQFYCFMGPTRYCITNIIVDGTNKAPSGSDGPYGYPIFHDEIWGAMISNHQVTVQSEGIPQTLNITNNGFGTPNPPAGANAYKYGNVVTASIAYASAITTSTQRHYCAWTGSGSGPSGGAAGNKTNNVVFTIAVPGGPPWGPGVSSLTWDWHLQYKLGTAKLGAAGFTDGDGTVTASDWHRTNMMVTIWATNPVGDLRWTNASWSGDTAGCTSTNGQSGLVVPMTQPRSITANFVYLPNAGPYTLTVTNTGDYGSPVPAAGATGGIADGTITNAIMNNSPDAQGVGTQMACIGWTGTGHTPSSGFTTNTGDFLMSSDSTVNWLWEQQHLLTILTAGAGSGTVTKNPNQTYFAADSSVDVAAQPGLGSVFANWSVADTNGVDTNSNPVSVTMSNAMTVTASFSLVGDSGPLGTTSAWYIAYGIHTNYGDMDSAEQGDDDSDGQLNWSEFVAGTDPSDSNSMFQVVSNFSGSASNCVVWYSTTNSGVTTPFSMHRIATLTGSTSHTNWTMVRTNDIPRTLNADGINVWWDTDVAGSNTYFYVPTILWVY